MVLRPQKIAITGCGGMLGEAVAAVFQKGTIHASDVNLNESWLDRLDVSSSGHVHKYLSAVEPDCIIHLAALTDMEFCEDHSGEAYATNTGGAENVARYARNRDIPLVYISTAGIFDGKKDSYDEADVPNPTSVYAASKYAGELLAKTVPKAIVIRAGWMMGGGPSKDKKFINKVARQIQNGSREILVVNDKFGSPCYTNDLARCIKFLVEREAYGIYHGACDGSGSRADVARHLLACLKVSDVDVREVDSNVFSETYFAPRPHSECLTNTKLKRLAPQLTRDWRECLCEYVHNYCWLGSR